MVVEVNTLPNHETNMSMAITEAAVAMAVAEGFKHCQETKFSRRGEPGKRQGSYRLEAQWWQGLAATKKTCFRLHSCV